MAFRTYPLALLLPCLLTSSLRLEPVYKASSDIWSEEKIVAYMDAHPNRAYFINIMRDGGFSTGMEVGVAGGRFSEHCLKTLSFAESKKFTWYMIEPLPNQDLVSRYPEAGLHTKVTPSRNESTKTWAERSIGENVKLKFFAKFSTDKQFLNQIPDHSIQFLYLDGAHDYENVKLELRDFWVKMAPGAVVAGHDYCNHGEESLHERLGVVPRCVPYTEYGVRHGKKKGVIAANQEGVVRAVQEFALQHPELNLHHTTEDFTKESLAKDGMEYDLVITNTYNPSWYFVLREEVLRRLIQTGTGIA